MAVIELEALKNRGRGPGGLPPLKVPDGILPGLIVAALIAAALFLYTG